MYDPRDLLIADGVLALLRQQGVVVDPETLVAAIAQTREREERVRTEETPPTCDPDTGDCPPSADTQTVVEAINDVVSMARQLADLPPPTKIKDDQGYAGSTDRPMRNYLAHVELVGAAIVPLIYHYKAASMLTLHKHTQLGTQRVETAIGTLRRALNERGATVPPDKGDGRFQVYDPKAAKVNDGSSYAFEQKEKRVRLTLPKRADGTRVVDLLRKANIPMGTGTWENTPGTVVRNDFVVPITKIGAVIDALAATYPTLADAVRTNRPVWNTLAGITEEAPPTTTRAGAAPTPAPPTSVATIAVEPVTIAWSGQQRGVSWVASPETPQALFLFDGGVARGLTTAWLREADIYGETAVTWKNIASREHPDFRLAIALDAAESVIDAITTKIPAIGPVLAGLRTLWRGEKEQAQALLDGDDGSGLRRLIRKIGWMMRPERRMQMEREGLSPDVLHVVNRIKPGDTEAGFPDGVSFDLWGENELRFRGLPYKPSMAIRAVPGVRATKNTAGIWENYVPLKRLPAVARALDDVGAYMLATALRVAFLVDTDITTCDELEELAAAGTLEGVKLPAARDAIVRVDAQLAKLLPPGLTLYPYQIVGVTYAQLAGFRCLIGDDPGLGKTLQAIGSILIAPKQLLPAVVVCPGSVLYNWPREFARWAPALDVKIYDGKFMPKCDVLVCTWDRLRISIDALLSWNPKLVVLDEAHNGRNADTGRAKAAERLTAQAPHLIELTGTAFINGPIELFPLVHQIDPQSFPSRDDFGKRYADAKHRKVVMIHPMSGARIEREYFDDRGATNMDELRDRLRCVMIRRLKSEVATELPEKTIQQIDIHFDDKVRAEYNALLKNWLKEYHTEKEIQGFTKEEIYKMLYAAGLIKTMKLRQFLGRTKVPITIDFALNFLDATRRQLVVFCEFVENAQTIAEALRAKGWRVATIIGSEDDAKRKEEKSERFRQHELDVIVATQSISEGMNLQTASDMIEVEYWWTSAKTEQGEARIHRRGQKRGVMIYRMHASDTFDEHVAEIVSKKRAKIEGVLGRDTENIIDAADGTDGALMLD